jgi:F-type H+-transporting ATPase subunit a
VAVLVPGLKAPSSSFKFTFALGLSTFCYVQYHALRENGLKRYVYHLMAEPKDAITWCLAPLFLVLEIISELIKPVSLSLRLFGNIFGEDKLLAIFLGLGIMLATLLPGVEQPIIGVPLHLPFFFLVVLLSTIQALVFSVLAAIYILLLLPHEHHEEEAGEEKPAERELVAQQVAEGQAQP